jgi:hypothetical protein
MGHLNIPDICDFYRKVLVQWADLVAAEDAIPAFRHVLRAGESGPHNFFELPVGPGEQIHARDLMRDLRNHLDVEMPDWTGGELPSDLRTVLENLIHLYRSRVIRASIERERSALVDPRSADGPTVRTVHPGDDLGPLLDEEIDKSSDEERADFFCLDLQGVAVDDEVVVRWVDEALAAVGRRVLYEVGAYLPRLAVRGHGFGDDLRKSLAVRYVLVLDGWDDPEVMIRRTFEGARSDLYDAHLTDLVAPFRPVRRGGRPTGSAKPASPFDVFPAHADPQVFADWIDSLRPDWD